MDGVVVFPESVMVFVEDILVSKTCSGLLHTIFVQDFGKSWQNAYWSVITE